ncbi:hypothetical protein N007_12075 [Alicyclobacillus acidoterrestris ATCC 49025]|nr:hypothetical protein N007_12075 [Alicyclobacillus acidoterrestris ATCC 49025]
MGSQDSLSPNLTVEIDSHLGSITKLNETKQNISNHHDHDHLRDMIISTLGKGSVNPGSVASLIALQESGTSDDMILWSLQRAAQANKHVGYAVGTIKRLRDQGIHTVAEAEAASSIQIDRPLTSNTVPTHNRDERYATFYALMGGKE